MNLSGCGPTVGHLLWEQAYAGSNPVTLTNFDLDSSLMDRATGVVREMQVRILLVIQLDGSSV